MAMNVLELEHVSKVYRPGLMEKNVRAVRDLSFVLGEEELVGFVGPNGAGKTTTLKLILGLLKPSGGSIRLMGTDAADSSSRTHVVFVSEQPYFYEYLTAAETLFFAARLRGYGSSSVRTDVENALAGVGLSGKAHAKVRSLSKGMRQRLNLAQALLGPARLFIFDEPMTGLDPPGRNMCRRLLDDLHRQGTTILFSTHILDDVESLCSRVIVLSQGSVRHDGSVSALLASGSGGTELLVSGLDEPSREHLMSQGCRIEEKNAGTDRILVPDGTDPKMIQEWLAGKGLFCDRVEPRMKSLEAVLYEQSGNTQGRGR